MKTLVSLVLKDFKRDLKRPWSILLFATLPVVMTGIIALVFGGGDGSAPVPTIHVAILDRDRDLVPRLLDVLLAQPEAAGRLEFRLVGDREEGIRLLERRKASALVVFPDGMTEGLLGGETGSIELYEDPAGQYLPKVVRQGVSMLAVALSGAAERLQDASRGTPVGPPDGGALARAALGLSSLEFLERLRRSLIQVETVAPADYRLQGTTDRPSP